LKKIKSMESILKIRDWIRTNGVMSENGKSITYSCKELEGIISEAISQLPQQETFVSNGSDEAEPPKHPSVISENGNELLFDKEGNLIKELPKQETLYTEEQMIGFAEWILNSDSKKVLTRTKESLLKEYIESLK